LAENIRINGKVKEKVIRYIRPAVFVALAAVISAGAAQNMSQPGLISSEFIYEEAPFPECHASTIVESKGTLIAAWFGGTREKHPDVGIWLARREGGKWTTPVEVANGVESADKRYPTWNPVLFQPKKGPLMLFYKVGPNPDAWWGMLMTSEDGGNTWSRPRRLPDGILGPIKNKPVELPNGDLLSPTSTEDQGWRVHFERSSDQGKTWQSTGPINDGKQFGAIQPSILFHKDGSLQAMCRSRQGNIVETWSKDQGRTWSPLKASVLPNPNSGTDAVTLRDGRQLLVYNHTTTTPGRWGGPRSPLNVAVSSDGQTWQAALVLESEPGEFSYPAVIQTADGLVHITYTWKRKKVRYVVVDPAKLQPKGMKDGAWPE
jgi:predicted neuraminidase